MIQGTPIKDKDNKTQNEENDIAETHEDDDYNNITKNGEEGESTRKETYDQEQKNEHPSDKGNVLRGIIIKYQDQNDQEDATIGSDGTDEKSEYKDVEQPEEVE